MDHPQITWLTEIVRWESLSLYPQYLNTWQYNHYGQIVSTTALDHTCTSPTIVLQNIKTLQCLSWLHCALYTSRSIIKRSTMWIKSRLDRLIRIRYSTRNLNSNKITLTSLNKNDYIWNKNDYESVCAVCVYSVCTVHAITLIILPIFWAVILCPLNQLYSNSLSTHAIKCTVI